MGDMNRREFTAQAVLALLSGVTITISGCGGGNGGGGPANPTPPLGPGDEAGSISGNHGHTAVVTAAEIMAGNSVSLDIQGAGDHNHRLSLTATEVTQIGAGQRVSKTTSLTDSHTHEVTFN
jgi:hypothetical protein